MQLRCLSPSAILWAEFDNILCYVGHHDMSHILRRMAQRTTEWDLAMNGKRGENPTSESWSANSPIPGLTRTFSLIGFRIRVWFMSYLLYHCFCSWKEWRRLRPDNSRFGLCACVFLESRSRVIHKSPFARYTLHTILAPTLITCLSPKSINSYLSHVSPKFSPNTTSNWKS